MSLARCLPIFSTLVLAQAALAGPDWDKDLQIDAGSGIATAQVITFNGQISTIQGTLAGSAFTGEGDFWDCYQINITDPGVFKVDLTGGGGGSVNFDAALFLFAADGKALLGTNDVSETDNAPVMTNASNAGPSVTITTPGLYYLCVTGFQSMPTWFGVPCFPSVVWDPGVIAGGVTYGWDDEWDSKGATGDYVMKVTGVSGVPAPGALALLGLAAPLASRRRRR